MTIKIEKFIFPNIYNLLIFFLQYHLINHMKNEYINESITIKKESRFLESDEEEKITNIISIGDKDFKYVNLVTYSNGDMIIETSSDNSSKRMFYGIKSNGRPIFDSLEQNYKAYFLSIEADDFRSESEIFIAKLNKDHVEVKEYLVNIAKENNYAEIYKLILKK